MAKSRYARNLLIGAFVNISLIVDFVKNANEDFLIICAGRQNSYGNFSLEDAVCAGMIITRLQKMEGMILELTDASLAAQALYKTFGKSVLKMLKSTEHGKYLGEIGFENDLNICAGIDTVPVLPQLTGTVIKIRKEEVKAELPVNQAGANI
jgi:2-phosphosulfolactate phosphatase